MLGQEESETSDDTVQTDQNISPTVNFDMNKERNTHKSFLKRLNEISSCSKQILHANGDAFNHNIVTHNIDSRSLQRPQNL